MLSNSPTNNPGILYVVATPVGSRDDITLRALRILGEVDLVAAEDTRHTGRLLKHHGIQTRFVAYHEHNETRQTPILLKKLQQGQRIALVSSAGTPTVSDPGYRLVEAATSAGIQVVPVPGVCAAVAALSASGLPTDSFLFVGFPQRKTSRRTRQLQALADEPRTLIFYESPRRLVALIEELAGVFGDRRAVLAREVTKRYEEFLRGSVVELKNRLRRRPEIKGECTLLVEGCARIEFETGDRLPPQVIAELQRRLHAGDVPLAKLVRQMSTKYKLPRNRLYEAALTAQQYQDERNHRNGSA
jgi:16S rRNA (cytidine1402-2'-O)-methyltransferase